jgi:hypothetical protein
MLPSTLFKQIESLIPTLDGWCTPDRACELAAQVIALKPSQTVCIGVWGGRDTFALALAHKFVGIGKVLAIDPWKAVHSVKDQVGEDAEWWSSQESHDLIYGRFIKRLGELEIQDYVDVQRLTSDEITPPNNISILVIDGNHGNQSVKDVKRFAANVVVGGICYMDDVSWTGGAVKKAISRLSKLGFIELFKRDTGIFFQRLK